MEDIIYQVALLLESDYYPMLILLTLFALAFSKHRRSLVLGMIIVTLLTPTLKSFYQEDRPCKELPALADCNDYGFPSGHAITSSLLPAATLGSFALVFFLPAAFFISFSRVYLGLHTINQVVGGVSLGLLIFFVLQRFYGEGGRRLTAGVRKGSAKFEDGRQLIHILGGFAIIAFMLWLGGSGGITEQAVASTELLLVALLISGMMLINMRMLGLFIGPFGRVLENFDRRDSFFPGRGPLLYVVGVLLILSYSRDFNFMLAALAIFATGDGFSTLIGRRFGRNKLPWNPRKSWEGTLAFLAFSSIAAYPFIGPMGLLYSAALALVETLDFHIDDNLLIPLFAVAMHTFIG